VVSGEIEIGLAFNHMKSTLEINVKECHLVAINEDVKGKHTTNP
jgi:hypothetical protein